MSEDWSFKKQLPQPETKKIKAECPVCHSTDHMWIQNGIAFCENCGWVEGDSPQ